MRAFVELVVMDEFGIRPLCPTPRGLIEPIRKGGKRRRVRAAIRMTKWTPDVDACNLAGSRAEKANLEKWSRVADLEL